MSIVETFFLGSGPSDGLVAGTPVVVETVSATTLYTSIAPLSETQAVIFYLTASGGSYEFKARVITVSGNVPTVGASVTLGSGSGAVPGNGVTIAAVTSTQVVAGWSNNKAMVLDVSGSTLTTNSTLTISGSSDYVTIGALTSASVLVAYSDGTNTKARVLTIASSTLTANTEYSIGTGAPSALVLTRLSASQSLIGYNETSTTKLMALDVVGTVISTNTATTVTNVVTGSLKISANNSTKATVTYFKSGPSYQTRTATIASSLVSLSGETQITVNDSAQTALVATSSDYAIFAFKNTSGGEGYAVVIGTASPVTIGTSVLYESGSTLAPALCRLTDYKSLVFYQDVSNSNYPTVCVLDMV